MANIPQAQMQQVATEFVKHYYQTFDSNLDGLAPLYRDQSKLTFEGEGIQGQQAIITKFKSLQLQTVQHLVKSFDVQPAGSGGFLVFVTGTMKINNVHEPRFSQCFHLIPEGTNLWLHNDVFRLG